MANGLVSYVHVIDDSGQIHAFGPDDQLPDWALAQMGPHCFEDGAKPAPSARPEPSTGQSKGEQS